MGFLVLGSMAAGLGATPALLVGSVIAFSIAAVLTISWREVVTYEDVAPQLEPVVEERE